MRQVQGHPTRHRHHAGGATAAATADNHGNNSVVGRTMAKQANNNSSNNNTNQDDYLTTKKVEVKRTKNTERRIQRQLVLEDGRVLEKDTPTVVVDTIEDIETHETDHVQDKAVLEDLQKVMARSYGKLQQKAAEQDSRSNRSNRSNSRGAAASATSTSTPAGGKSKAAVNGTSKSRRGGHEAGESGPLLPVGNLVSDTFQRTVNTHDVQENITRTRMAQDLGLISRRGIERLLRGEGSALTTLDGGRNGGGLYDGGGGGVGRDVVDRDNERRLRAMGIRLDKSRSPAAAAASSNPVKKHVYEASSRRKVVDTEDVHNISRRDGRTGKVTSETVRTNKHEVFDDKEAPDDGSGSGSSDGDVDERGEKRYFHDKTENFIDYYRTTGNASRGKAERHLVAKGPHIVTENREYLTPLEGGGGGRGSRMDRGGREGTQEEQRQVRRGEAATNKKKQECSEAERKDALTRRPLNFVAEEKTRRKETDKWLERHFGGSEWSLFSGSLGTNEATVGGGNSNSVLARRRVLRQFEEAADPDSGRPQTAQGFMHPGHTNTLAGHSTTAGRNNQEDFNSKVRRTQSFSSIPIHYQNPAGKSSRIIKQTTTTYRPGFDKVVFSSVTRNIVPPRQQEESAKLQRAYHSTHNISSYQQEADFSGGDVPGVASVAGIHRGSQNLTKAHSATSLANGGGHEGRAAERLHQSGGPPVRQVLIDEGVPGGAPRAVHARVNELRGGRSKEREKSHFQQSVSNTHLDKVEHQDDFYHFGHLGTDTYLRDDGEEVDENGSRDRRHRPSERHAKQKYERVQSAPNYTTSQHFEDGGGHVRNIPIEQGPRVHHHQQQPQPEAQHHRGHSAANSPQPPQTDRKPRRLLPDVEGRSRVHRSESAKTREPLYRTELPRRKLYPSPTKRDSDRHQRHPEHRSRNSPYNNQDHSQDHGHQSHHNHHYSHEEEVHNYYHHRGSSHRPSKTRHGGRGGVGGSGHNFTQSFQDLNDASSYYHDSLLVDDSGYDPGANTMNDGMGTTLNFDFLLEPRDYCDHKNEERREGRRGASSGGRVSRKDKQRGASTGLSTDINHHHHLSSAPPGVGGEHFQAGGINVKRSRSFYAAPEYATTSTPDAKSANRPLFSDHYVHKGTHTPSTKENYYNTKHHDEEELSYRRSRTLKQDKTGMSGGGKSSGRRFADDFHRNKRHTFHFPDKENYCEDLNFSKKLSSSSKNISDASAEQPTTFHDFCGTGAADATQTSFLHIDKEIPMQSASLEAQKFKTIIFLSGQ